MNYRRRHDQRQQRESSFLRNWSYETPKEALGKLAEWSGGPLGLLAGAAAARRGVPMPPAVASTMGMFIGLALGVVAKAAVNAGFDTLKNRGSQNGPSESAGFGQAQQPVRLATDLTRHPTRGRRPQLGRRAGVDGGSNAGVSAGSVINEMEQILAMIDRNHYDLSAIIDRIRDNHAWLMAVLTGASPSLLQRIDGQSNSARRAIEEACTLLRLSRDSLRSYVRTI